ncbi:transmembrane protein, putative [Medicago truncatula]|uniref:Transmembrane protein, putative n=1 Tax=Medicago truncatula TaxID=3880 RepID=G7J1K7_MEDTR|nr:transmembrane protein, putative [Medicago truncatula]
MTISITSVQFYRLGVMIAVSLLTISFAISVTAVQQMSKYEMLCSLHVKWKAFDNMAFENIFPNRF